jgi:ABC-type lipoprotein export system ATPase subunit
MSFSIRKTRFLYSPGDDAKDDVPFSSGIYIENLDIQPKGITAVIGPSGSGKTTLLSILAGFITPVIEDDGKLEFRGSPIGKGGYAAGDVAFVFQNPMLLGSASGIVNVLQGHVATQSARKTREKNDHNQGTLRQLLGDLGLAGTGNVLLGKRSRHLSGGEAQRISIVRALLSDPHAILCDEPTSALDEYNARKVMETLKEWSATRERPVVWVTHNLEQAAKYADHFVFVANGEIRTLDGNEDETLPNLPENKRIVRLREIMKTCGHRTDVGEKTPYSNGAGADDTAIGVGPFRYARWIANALSTDSTYSEGIEKRDDTAMLPAGQLSLLARLDNRWRKKPGGFPRFLNRLFGYSRYPFALILSVLLLQIIAAGFFGSLAVRYSRVGLQDPSVARLVFEHVIDGVRMGRDGVVPDIQADTVLADMQAELRTAMEQRGQDPDRVLFFGRRSVPDSALRFPDANENCRGWQPLDTVALDADDPLVLQTRLNVDDPGLEKSPADITRLALQSRDAYLDGEAGEEVFRHYAMLDAGIIAVLRKKCGLDPDRPLVAEWAAGSGGMLNPVTMTISGGVTRNPPIYPNLPQLLVFEHDYQFAKGKIDAGSPPGFRIATAYFPIDGFGEARDLIEKRGYLVRDDSKAAVDQLKTIARVAETVPFYVISLNLIGGIVVIMIVISGLLELNKRVIALFMAHGFRFLDLVLTMVLHLAPAFIVAFFASLLLAGGAWYYYLVDRLPTNLGALHMLAIEASLHAAKQLTSVGIAILLLVVAGWWRFIRRNLKTFLQE